MDDETAVSVRSGGVFWSCKCKRAVDLKQVISPEAKQPLRLASSRAQSIHQSRSTTRIGVHGQREDTFQHCLKGRGGTPCVTK